MNKLLFSLCIATSFSSLVLPSTMDEEIAKEGRFVGGISTYNTRKAAEAAKVAVETAAKALESEKMHDSGHGLSKGFLSGLDDKELTEKGKSIGAGIVLGAAGAVKSGMLTGVASAKATAIAVATAPATPLVAAGGVFAYLGYLGIGIEKNKTYGRCIRTHWDSPALNENGVPKRCDSPARRAAWWYPKIADRQNRYAGILRAEGRRPRKLTDENYYSIGEISSHDLDGKDDK